MHSRIRVTLVSVAVLALLAAACGDSDESAPRASRSAGDVATGVLPDITVRDVTADADVALREFEPSSGPVLYWFWAPH